MSENPPDFYKYKAFDGPEYRQLRDVLIGNNVWAGSPNAFNDPFDCLPAIDTSGSEKEMLAWATKYVALRMSSATRQQIRSQAREVTKSLRNGELGSGLSNRGGIDAMRVTLKDMGVLSLTTNPESILMWGHYARSHKGYCLRFDGHIEPFQRALRINYSPERPVFRVLDPDRGDIAERCLLRKADVWSYEEEWRYVSPGSVGLVNFPPEALTGLILGAATSALDREALMEILSERPTPIEVMTAAFDDRYFKMHVKADAIRV